MTVTSTLNREGMERSSLTRMHNLRANHTRGACDAKGRRARLASDTWPHPMSVDMLQCGMVGVNRMEIIPVSLSITTPSGCITFSSSSECGCYAHVFG